MAAFGNVLRGDDGFGIAVLRRLEDAGVAGRDVELLEVGTAGIRLAQELLRGYDRLIVVDAVAGGRAPGSVSIEEVLSVEPATEVDMHEAVPARALAVAQALKVLPRSVFIVGCEPEGVDDLTTELSPALRVAVSEAAGRILELIAARPRPAAEA